MDLPARLPRADPVKWRRIRIALACAAAFACFWLLLASPVFLVSLGARIASGDLYTPSTVSRMPGPWGDGYLVIEDGADTEWMLFDTWGREICRPGGGLDGEGDGRCPGALSQRWISIPLWSLDWVRQR